MKKKTLYIDMDGVLADFQSGINRLPTQLKTEFEKRLDEVPGIFSLMDPMPGAIEAYERLSEKFDTYILSTAPWENPSAWSDKLLWVKKHLGKAAYKRLILSHHKNLLKGDFIIDDRDKRGVPEFEGEHIFFGKEKFPDWKTVVDYLESILEKEERLRNVPVEDDTLIVFEKMHDIKGISVLYQKWRWSDYLADSIIFLDEDVAGMSEDEITALVRQDATCRKGSKITFSQKGSGYTFVNYNFEEDEPDFSVDMEKLKKQTQHVERWEKEIKERDEALKDKQKRQKPIG